MCVCSDTCVCISVGIGIHISTCITLVSVPALVSWKMVSEHFFFPGDWLMTVSDWCNDCNDPSLINGTSFQAASDANLPPDRAESFLAWFLGGHSFGLYSRTIIQRWWKVASPRVLLRAAQHAFLQRQSNGALSAGTRIKWIEHSCPSRLYCRDRGKVIYSELQSLRGSSWSFAATAPTSQVGIPFDLVCVVYYHNQT